MTRKHYEAIAAIIRAQVDAQPNIGGHTYTQDIARALADYFEQDNPKFKRARFLEACGVEQTAPTCPQCGAKVWDIAKGSKLNKCHGCGTAFDNM